MAYFSFYQFQWPSRRTVLAFGGVFCALTGAVLYVYPALAGHFISGVLGAGETPLFWARHPAAYAAVQAAVRGVYAVAAVGTLDFFLLLFLYKLLDELVTRQGVWGGLWRVSWRAWKPLLGLQVLAGAAVCLTLLPMGNFSVFSLIPSFFSSSPEGSVWTCLWEISVICFGCGFAAEESVSGALRLGWRILKARPLFWSVALLAGFLLTWGPAAALAAFGMENGGFGSVLFMLWGAVSHFGFITALLISLFNQPGLFDA